MDQDIMGKFQKNLIQMELNVQPFTQLMIGHQYTNYREDLGGLCSTQYITTYAYETFEDIINLIKEKR